MTGHTTERKPASRTAGRLTNAEAARQLGVTREHLSRVLHGHRPSRSLLRRYEALRIQHAMHNPPPAASR